MQAWMNMHKKGRRLAPFFVLGMGRKIPTKLQIGLAELRIIDEYQEVSKLK